MIIIITLFQILRNDDAAAEIALLINNINKRDYPDPVIEVV